ncbi:hypothetical protein [Phenylobacterium sp.]|uniref:hypothetical protein n=1 Tax=Phenylobacterium sp. TaxID=1871053 RepID=UPI002C415771|nr:hypothetical protein [Phenylobacterium sp.]HLZ75130.1 hypothetical protein [Phenylobacterium sp.]
MVIRLLPIAAGLMVAAITSQTANAAPDKKSEAPCFASSTWQGWSAPGDGSFLYIRVGQHDIYQVGLPKGSHVRKDLDVVLVDEVRGSDWICSPLDLDLTLNDHGFREPIIAKSLRKLTPEEVAAIPRKDLPD